MKEKTLIIGKGEVGSSLYEVLTKVYFPVYIKDIEPLEIPEKIKWMHICFPYSKNFMRLAKAYIKKYKPTYTIIHSTVPVGTTKKLGRNVWHSPIRGVHPNIALGIQTFDKYIGGRYCNEVIKYLQNAKIPVVYTTKSENTELGKLLDTTYYGWNIAFCKEAERICKKYKADFSVVYSAMNRSYNDGYRRLGKINVIRPVLSPVNGKIGGHCVIPNCKLLNESVCNILLNLNKKW